MNKSEILKCIKSNRNVKDYEISIVEKDSRELFYVLKHLEINRAVKTATNIINIYSIDSKGTGCSMITVTSADNNESLTKKINNALKKSKNSKNKYYPLTPKTKNIKEQDKKKYDLNAIANNVAKAIFKADVYKNGWINSTEIFVTKYCRQFINSNGVFHCSFSFKIEIECIPTWSNNNKEYELYKFYETNSIDYKKISKEINEILMLSKERAKAKLLSSVSIPSNIKVLVKNDMRDLLVENLCNQLTYKYKYSNMNQYAVKDIVSNTPFDLVLKSKIKGLANSKTFDGNGVTLHSKKIIENGFVKDLHGDLRFGSYLNIKNITGILPLCELKSKGISYSKEKHLIIETFSSPQLEESTGYWGGEVRLARYYDGKKYIPLTGFSISGNIYEDIKTIKFSKEIDSSSSYIGPKYFIFNKINIQ